MTSIDRILVPAAIALTIGAAACQTREEAAKSRGREAAVAAARVCPSDAGQFETCREPICRDRCAAFDDSPRLGETCAARCMGRGTCESDADCAGGLVCVMIAPRLRRCLSPPDASP